MRPIYNQNYKTIFWFHFSFFKSKQHFFSNFLFIETFDSFCVYYKKQVIIFWRKVRFEIIILQSNTGLLWINWEMILSFFVRLFDLILTSDCFHHLFYVFFFKSYILICFSRNLSSFFIRKGNFNELIKTFWHFRQTVSLIFRMIRQLLRTKD